MHPAEAFLIDQLPKSQWAQLPSILKTAYCAVDELFNNEPLFDIGTAAQMKGRIISLAVDRGIVRAIESGNLVCDYRFSEFAKPTGVFLELMLPYLTLSVNQVSVAKYQPRQVRFRENKRLLAQPCFDFENQESQSIQGKPHYLMVHGYQNLDFIHLALPSGVSAKKYEWRSPNLLDMPHEIAADNPPLEDTDTDFEGMELLKEDIRKWIRDNDE